MKKTLLLLILAFAAVTAQAQTANLVGTWTDVKEPGKALKLLKTGYASFVAGNEEIGGESFVVAGKTMQLKYKIDYTKNPVWIDFVKVEKSSGKQDGQKMLGIITIIDDNTIGMMINEGTRPLKMDKSNAGYAELKRKN